MLCGGLALRMLPRTANLPKFLLPVSGRAFGERLVNKIARAGYEEVVLCVGHLGHEIRAALGDGARLGVRVVYSDEGEHRLGTLGALEHAAPLLDESFLVTYGDSYLPSDYAAPLDDLRAHADGGALGTMVVWENDDAFDASNCAVEGELVSHYEKRPRGAARRSDVRFIDYGATALRRSALDVLPSPGNAPRGLDVLQSELARLRRLRAWRATSRFYEIGSPSGLADLEAHLGAVEAEVSP